MALVFSNVAYAWPANCDILQCHINKLLIIEKQAMRICHHTGKNNIMLRLEGICQRLINKIKNEEVHPLRDLIIINNTNTYNLRHRTLFLPPNFKSSRLLKSFIGSFKLS